MGTKDYWNYLEMLKRAALCDIIYQMVSKEGSAMKVENGFTFFFFRELSCEGRKVCKQESYNFLQDLEKEYPAFGKWFARLFASPECLEREREILFCMRDGEIAGLAILKRTPEEQKICTLRVGRRFQGRSVGRLLMQMSFEWLENDRPLITVHQSRYREFKGLFQYYGFELEDKKWCYYKLFQTELAFNGELPRRFILPERRMIGGSILLPERFGTYTGKFGYAGAVQ